MTEAISLQSTRMTKPIQGKPQGLPKVKQPVGFATIIQNILTEKKKGSNNNTTSLVLNLSKTMNKGSTQIKPMTKDNQQAKLNKGPTLDENMALLLSQITSLLQNILNQQPILPKGAGLEKGSNNVTVVNKLESVMADITSKPTEQLKAIKNLLANILNDHNFNLNSLPNFEKELNILMQKLATVMNDSSESQLSTKNNQQISAQQTNDNQEFPLTNESVSLLTKVKSKSQSNQLSINAGPMHRIEQLVVHNQQSQNDQGKTDPTDVIKQISTLLAKNAVIQDKSGNTQLHLKLHPDHLGELTITLTKDDSGGMVAKLQASTPAAKDLLQSQIGQLKQTFISHNLSVNRVEVYDQTQFSMGQNQQNQDQPSHQQQQQEPSPNYSVVDDNRTTENEEQFNDWLKLVQ